MYLVFGKSLQMNMNSTSEMMNSYRMTFNFTNKSEEHSKQGMASQLLGEVVVLSVYFIIGVIGNSIVLAVYRYQIKR